MKTLREISQFQIGFTLARAKASFGNLENYSYQTFSINAFPSHGIQMIRGCENPYLANEKISPNYFTQKGDVVVRLRVPILAVCIGKDEEGLLVSSLAIIVRADEKQILGEYLAYYLNSSFAQNYFQTKARGTAIPMIRISDLKEMSIPIPPIEKQKQIIALMQESEKQISLFTQLIEQKTALKQQIFKSLIKE